MSDIDLSIKGQKIFDTQGHYHDAVKCPRVSLKASANGNNPFTIGSAYHWLANKYLLAFIFLVIDKE